MEEEFRRLSEEPEHFQSRDLNAESRFRKLKQQTFSPNIEEQLTETPKRPKPTTLDIPGVRKTIADIDSSPETPSYSSRPLPLSPRCPAIADIPLNSPDKQHIYQNVRKSSAEITFVDVQKRSFHPSPKLASPEDLTPSINVPLGKLDNSSDVDEFNDELQFDPTISSGFYRSLGEGGFRSTPITVGVCPTPQPLAPTPQPFAPPLPPTKPDSKVKRLLVWGIIFLKIILTFPFF